MIPTDADQLAFAMPYSSVTCGNSAKSQGPMGEKAIVGLATGNLRAGLCHTSVLHPRNRQAVEKQFRKC
jgi:hypothetical protein